MNKKAPNPDSSGTHMWLILMKAQKTLERHAIRSVEKAGLGLSDFGILEALLHKGPLLVNDLGRRINLTSGSITTAVDRMEAQGWVERVADPRDRRARRVRLTPKGESQIVPVFAAHRQAMDGVAEGLTKAERLTLIRLLKKLGLYAQEKIEQTKED
ncbi:MAG: transcriptional regulator, MarR family [Fibrobacteres bacterium]|nr:transcriptional regulator, MarR family [Fibrobacterota bacterium]